MLTVECIKKTNQTRIKKSLGYLSPVEYRQSLGLAA
ncbi:IS3 family transposase [Kandleria vitulina]